jgi:hypothetical protein
MTPEIVRGIARSEVYRGLQPALYSVGTTDATATLIASIDVQTYERGIVECKINGVKDDGITGISIHKVFSYKTDDTTLTVHSGATLYSQSDLTTAGVAANANGFQVEIKVTGEASTNILWSLEHVITKITAEVAGL